MKKIYLFIGGGGVGKTTIAASFAVLCAREYNLNTLVMTFDPSLRLKDSLGISEKASGEIVKVENNLFASLLDAKKTFDNVVKRYAPDQKSAERILQNRYYNHLAGSLSGMIEYMAVEKLYEVWSENKFDTIIVDTPPTRNALDFLNAPKRIVTFIESGALKIALYPWFDKDGRIRTLKRLGFIGKKFESWLDELVGLDLLRDMHEFFAAFGPLFDGFKKRALEVEQLLANEISIFNLVASPNPKLVPDTIFFAREIQKRNYNLGPVLVNKIHPPVQKQTTLQGEEIPQWLGKRDMEGVEMLKDLLSGHPVIEIPLLPEEVENLNHLHNIATTYLNKLFKVQQRS